MPKILPNRCKRCGKSADDGWQISRRALCIACRQAAIADAVEAMQVRRGPAYAKWVAAGGNNGRVPNPPGVVDSHGERDAHGRYAARVPPESGR